MDAERPGRSWRNPGFAQLGSHPAVCLSWIDAKTYVDWLATLTGRGYRMLSEAEWEYAARGETAANSYKRYWFGDDEKDLCLNANGADQTTRESIQEAAGWTVAPCNDLYAYSSPVGSFTPNGFGLYDMHGNAWQWTEDCYHETYAGAPVDGSAWVTGDCSRRVLRGGSWVDDPKSLRAASRDWDPSGDRYFSYGIRVARTLIR